MLRGRPTEVVATGGESSRGPMSPADEGGWVVPMRSAPTPAGVLLPSALAGAVVTAVLALLLVRGMTYRATVAWSLDLHAAVQETFAVVSEYGVLALMTLFGAAALVARRDEVACLAKGVAAGVGVVLAYLSSEAIKVLVSELRPCHATTSRWPRSTSALTRPTGRGRATTRRSPSPSRSGCG